MNKNHKRISAAVLSLALGFTIAGAPMLAPVAGAQASITAGDVSTVDLDRAVTLNIQKFSGDPVVAPAEPAPGNALRGVGFTVTKINLGADLDTLAGWNAVAAAQQALVDGTSLSTGQEWVLDPTDANGNTSISTGVGFENFTVGAYLVTETSPADGYTVAKPFIVTLPFTNGDNGWEYTRTVQPKNQTVSLEKNVEDETVALGNNIGYTISASIPAEAMTELSIEDELPAELGQAQNVVVRTTGAAAPAVDAPLTPVADYTVTVDAPAGAGNGLFITLTEDGLSELNARRENSPNLELLVEFDARVIALPDDGVIRNDVTVNYPNSTVTTDPTDPNYTDDPEGGAETRLGQLTITKVDADDEEIAAGTATFQLWRCALDAGNNKWTVSGIAPLGVHTNSEVMDVTTEAELDAYLAIPANAPLSSFNTVDGQATLYGIRAFNYVDGATTANTDICLVETVAPEGYSLNPEPQPVQNYENADPAAGNYAMASRVINIDETALGELPATGGQGTLAMIAAGLLVAVAGGFATLRGNRARK